MKLRRITNSSDAPWGYVFWCPGCNDGHQIPVEAKGGWTFNGNTEAPTFSPSVLVYETKREDGRVLSPRCHSFVRAGRIEFLSDCTHALGGKTVELPDCPEDWISRGFDEQDKRAT